MAALASARVAVVHDWLTGMRGGEKVLEAILELCPSAEIFTLFHFPGSVSSVIEDRTIHVSRLQRWAEKVDDYRKLLPFFPRGVRDWDFSGFDLIISSSHCVAKAARAEGVPHVSYCHTPMRYIWDRFDDYFPRSRPFQRMGASMVARTLRPWDVATAAHVDHFVSNSAFVRDRIARFYERDATVVYPFVDPRFFEPRIEERREPYHVIVSALVPYKRIDVAIGAAGIAGRKLLIIGEGPLGEKLAAQAVDGAEFLGRVSTEVLMEKLGRAESMILPGVEDFGITALEALALGTPVIAVGEGGALESVGDERHGLFFPAGSSSALAAAIVRAEQTAWDRGILRARAAEFSRARFLRDFGEILDRYV